MDRREFLRQTSLALVGLALGMGLPERKSQSAAEAPLTFALLADAHLQDGNPKRPEARALARAVAEIKAFRPRPDLVLFAGDLAHDGHPHALGLGQEILSGLKIPLLAVPGEGDVRGASSGEAFGRFRSRAPFYHRFGQVHLVGLAPGWQEDPAGPAFRLGPEQLRWLLEVLARLEPAEPVIILSHAPLVPHFRPWGQWLAESRILLAALRPFKSVVWCHGHAHHYGSPGQTRDPDRAGKLRHFSLPATSWPYPLPQLGTPPLLKPGSGPQNCGWLALTFQGSVPRVQAEIWPA